MPLVRFALWTWSRPRSNRYAGAVPVVELYGQARLLCGCRSVHVPGATLREILTALARLKPALIGAVLSVDGQLTPAYAANLNGLRFCTNPNEPVAETDQLLLISSLSGG